MSNTKKAGKASQNNEVRCFDEANNRWAIMGRSNGSIVYYAQSEDDARQTLQLWDSAPDLLAALQLVLVHLDDSRVDLALYEAHQGIKKATGS